MDDWDKAVRRQNRESVLDACFGLGILLLAIVPGSVAILWDGNSDTGPTHRPQSSINQQVDPCPSDPPALDPL